MAGIAGAVRCKALPSRIHPSTACCAGEGRTRGFANTGKDLAGDPLKIPVRGGACAACALPKLPADEPPDPGTPHLSPMPNSTRCVLILGTTDICRAAKPSPSVTACAVPPLPVGELSAQLTERAEDHLPLGKHPWRTLPQCAGATSNAGSPPAHRKPNTFVKPAELAHRASKAVRQL